MKDVLTGTSYDFNIWSDGLELSDNDAVELRAIIEQDPDDAVSILQLQGYSYNHHSAENVEEWVKTASWFIRNRPGDWVSSGLSPHSLLTAEHQTLLDSLWTESLKNNPANAAVLGRGGQHFRHRDDDKAFEYLNKAILLEPASEEWHTSLSYHYQQLSENDNFANQELISLAFLHGAKAVKHAKLRGPRKGLMQGLCLFGLDSNRLKEAAHYARHFLREARQVSWNYDLFTAHILHRRVQLKLGNLEFAKKDTFFLRQAIVSMLISLWRWN